MKQDVSCVILAAGNSSRMNFPKPFLPFDESKNFIEHIIEVYCVAGVNEIILVTNGQLENKMRRMVLMHYQHCNVHVIVNYFPERGRFFSIKLGLQLVKTNRCFFQNIDNPFITTGLLQKMMNAAGTSDYVVPCYKKKTGHPILIGDDLKDHLLSLKGCEHNLKDELRHFPRSCVDTANKKILANINTHEEFEKYFVNTETHV